MPLQTHCHILICILGPLAGYVLWSNVISFSVQVYFISNILCKRTVHLFQMIRFVFYCVKQMGWGIGYLSPNQRLSRFLQLLRVCLLKLGSGGILTLPFWLSPLISFLSAPSLSRCTLRCPGYVFGAFLDSSLSSQPRQTSKHHSFGFL